MMSISLNIHHQKSLTKGQLFATIEKLSFSLLTLWSLLSLSLMSSLWSLAANFAAITAIVVVASSVIWAVIHVPVQGGISVLNVHRAGSLPLVNVIQSVLKASLRPSLDVKSVTTTVKRATVSPYHLIAFFVRLPQAENPYHDSNLFFFLSLHHLGLLHANSCGASCLHVLSKSFYAWRFIMYRMPQHAILRSTKASMQNMPRIVPLVQRSRAIFLCDVCVPAASWSIE